MRGHWVDDIEDAIAAAADNLVRLVQGTLAAVGPRPFGAVQGDRWTQLEQYLAIRDDPAAWQATLMAWAQEIGEAAAAELAVRETTRYENQLLRLGRWDGTPEDTTRAQRDGAAIVRATLTLKRLRKAVTAANRADAIAARPPVLILPPLPPQAEEFTADQLPSLLMRTGAPAALMPAPVGGLGEEMEMGLGAGVGAGPGLGSSPVPVPGREMEGVA